MSKYDFLHNVFKQPPVKLGEQMRMPLSDRYGSCMSLYNLDKLDMESLGFAQSLLDKQPNTPVHAVDLGASCFCPQSLRLASLGAHVDAFDIEPAAKEVNEIIETLPGQLNYHTINLLKVDDDTFKKSYDIIYANRCFLFLPYKVITNILSLLVARMLPNGRGYVSFGNLDATEAASYTAKEKPLDQRFTTIISEIPNEAGVKAPISLFHLNEIEPYFLKNLPIRILSLEDIGDNLNSIKLIFEKT